MGSEVGHPGGGVVEIWPYYAENSQSARYNDLIALADPLLRGDLDYYLRSIPPGAHVLELGCGSGRVALALAQKGYSVTGIDIAPAMLNRAKAKRRELPAAASKRVRFVLGDMVTLRLSRTFDAVIAPYYTFNHVEGERRVQALAAIARHLAGGRAHLHVMTPEAIAYPLPPEEGKRRFFLRQSGNDIMLRWCALWRAIDTARGRTETAIELTLMRQSDSRIVRQTTELLVQYWFDDAQLEAAAAEAGMRVVAVEHSSLGEDPTPLAKMYVLETARPG